jgi:hypothetical protein
VEARAASAAGGLSRSTARPGLIDRSVGRSACARRSYRPTRPIACSMLRCRRTDARNLMVAASIARTHRPSIGKTNFFMEGMGVDDGAAAEAMGYHTWGLTTVRPGPRASCSCWPTSTCAGSSMTWPDAEMSSLTPRT